LVDPGVETLGENVRAGGGWDDWLRGGGCGCAGRGNQGGGCCGGGHAIGADGGDVGGVDGGDYVGGVGGGGGGLSHWADRGGLVDDSSSDDLLSGWSHIHAGGAGAGSGGWERGSSRDGCLGNGHGADGGVVNKGGGHNGDVGAVLSWAGGNAWWASSDGDLRGGEDGARAERDDGGWAWGSGGDGGGGWCHVGGGRRDDGGGVDWGRDSGGWWSAREAHGVDGDGAVLLVIVVVVRLEGDTLGTTALLVLDSVTALGATLSVLALLSVIHVELEVNINVEINGDIKGSNGEAILVGSARWLAWQVTGDALLLDTSVEGLASGSLAQGWAGESSPAQSSIDGELTEWKLVPVITVVLVRVAGVVAVRWAVELVVVVAVPECCSLLDSKAEGDDDWSGTHIELNSRQ
jgi:hypothetical protein